MASGTDAASELEKDASVSQIVLPAKRATYPEHYVSWVAHGVVQISVGI